MKNLIPIEMDSETERTRGVMVPLGDLLVQTERGPIHAIEAPGWPS